MSTRSALTIVGGVVGAYFGYPQLGLAIGALVGGAVDPQTIQGPKIGEVSAQTSAEGAPRTIVYGTMAVYGNVIQTGPLIKTTSTETQGKGGPVAENEVAYRTYAIRICEGPIQAVLRVWADNKLVYDVRPGSAMVAESAAWAQWVFFHLGDEAQLPDVFLTANVSPDSPAYRGTAYAVFLLQDLTDRRGSIPQYRFEVTTANGSTPWDFTWTVVNLPTASNVAKSIDQNADGQMYVSVKNEEVLGSTDGIVWTKQTGTAPSNEVMIYSPDIDVWTAPTGNFGSGFPQMNVKHGSAPWSGFTPAAGTYPGIQTWEDGVWAADRFVLVGNSGRASGNFEWATSLDGTTWTTSPAAARGWKGLAYSPSLDRLVAVNGAQAGVSNDRGLTWTDYTVTGAALVGIVWVQSLSLFVSVGASTAAWSPDGMTWTLGTWTGAALPGLHTLAWSPERSLFIAPSVSGLGTDAQYCAVSTDGKAWVRQYVALTFPSFGDTPRQIIWNPVIGKFVYICNDQAFVSNTVTASGQPVTLASIVADIHDRCDISPGNYDVAELTDLVDGMALAGDYTGADAINSVRPLYFFDKSEHDAKLWYPKRGAAVYDSWSIDDLTEVPDSTQREQALEIPKKLHLFYQHAISGYARVKATAASSSPDLMTTGEVTIEVPVVLDEDQAAQAADKAYKVTRAEINGTTEISIPLDVGIQRVPSNPVGLTLRGTTRRLRVDSMAYADGVFKLSLKNDRQSAYTSNLTGVPIPPPTLPPSTIVGETVFAVLDIAARVDSEDDLNYLVAVTGESPAWHGARYQRSLDTGANWTTVQDITTASIIGYLQDDVPSASEDYTDTTNSVTVHLIRDGQTLDSLTDAEFLSEGGAFALEKADGSFELMQYLDAEQDSAGDFRLTTLHRGLLNSGAAAHTTGARFVMLARPTHINAQASWIGMDLTHRAISLGDTADNTDNEETATFVGRSQLEWPVASFTLSRSVDDVTASWVPRHRFGSDDYPVASVNFQGYRVTITGTGTITFDTTAQTFTQDVSSIGGSVTVSVSALNRITGAGPATSGTI